MTDAEKRLSMAVATRESASRNSSMVFQQLRTNSSIVRRLSHCIVRSFRQAQPHHNQERAAEIRGGLYGNISRYE